MGNGILEWVSFGEEECFQPVSKRVERGGRSKSTGRLIQILGGKTKTKLLGGCWCSPNAEMCVPIAQF